MKTVKRCVCGSGAMGWTQDRRGKAARCQVHAAWQQGGVRGSGTVFRCALQGDCHLVSARHNTHSTPQSKRKQALEQAAGAAEAEGAAPLLNAELFSSLGGEVR